MVVSDDGRALLHSARSAAHLPSGQSCLVFGNTVRPVSTDATQTTALTDNERIQMKFTKLASTVSLLIVGLGACDNA